MCTSAGRVINNPDPAARLQSTHHNIKKRCRNITTPGWNAVAHRAATPMRYFHTLVSDVTLAGTFHASERAVKEQALEGIPSVGFGRDEFDAGGHSSTESSGRSSVHVILPFNCSS